MNQETETEYGRAFKDFMEGLSPFRQKHKRAFKDFIPIHYL
jgi:hypothetical protein